MHYRLYIAACALSVAALGAAAALRLPWWVGASLAVTALVLLALLWRSVAKPMDAVQNGLYLLRSQDFASRLSRTGQADADRVAELFNRMMDALKAERLKNEEQNHLLSKLIEASPNGIAICNFDGDIADSNGSFRAMADERVMTAIAQLRDDETRVLRLDGGRVYRISRLWFMDSGFRRRFYLVSPMTDEILRAERQVYDRMVRTIGHEVNNSLGSTMSVLDSMADAFDADTLERMAVDSCRSSCENLVAFVQRYAQLAKLPRPRFTPLDLHALVEGMLPQLRAMASPGTRFEYRCDGATMLQADGDLLQRVLINVVKNAVEAIDGRPGAYIVIRLSGRCLEIVNNGRDITPEEAQQLFTPFYSTKNPDRGLGLMLVADILRAHGATCTLNSRDGETVFTALF